MTKLLQSEGIYQLPTGRWHQLARAGSAQAGRWVLLVVAALLLGVGPIRAQTVIIGSTTIPVASPATSTFYKGPIYRSSAASAFNYSRFAYIYTAAELSAAGILPGATITDLAWLKADAATVTGNNSFEVRMANTALATITDFATWGSLKTGTTVTFSSTTLVVSGAAGAYLAVTNTTGFVYTGGNLLILTDWVKAGTASAAVNFVTNAAANLGAGNGSNVAFTDADVVTTNNSSTSYGSRRPTLRLTYAPASPCTAPPTAGTTVASVTNGCGTVASTLSLTGSATGTGLTYQWQQSSTGAAGSYTAIASATSASYAATGLTSTTYFQAVVTCSGQSATSTPATVTVNSATAPYASLPLTESFESWSSLCDNSEVPSPNWRSTPTTGDNSWRRDDQGYTTSAWRFIGADASTFPGARFTTGAHSARFHSYGAASGTGVLDLYANISGSTGTPSLAFDYTNATGADKLEVLLSTDGGQTFGATPIFTQVLAPSWTHYTVPLTGATATSVIRFRATTDFGDDDIGLDNVSLVYVACAQVASLTATNVTTTTASLTFTPPAGGGTYTVTYTPTGGATTTVTPAPTASPVPLTGLIPGTTYAVSVVTNCSSTSTSTAATTSFSTPLVNDQCSGAIALTCGQTVTGTTVGATTTGDPTATCGPTVSSQPGVFYSYLGTGDIVTVNTCSGPTGTSGDTELFVYSGTCAALTCVGGNDDTPSCSNGTASTVTFTSTLGTQYYFFVQGYSSDLSFGLSLTCTPLPTCAPVTALTAANITTTTANLTFTAGAGNTSYTVTYTPTGGATTTLTPAPTASPVPLTGLTPGTTYAVSVLALCSSGTTTAVTTSFTTAYSCVAPTYATVPYTQTFENAFSSNCALQDVPDGSWRNTPATGDNSWRRVDNGAAAGWSSNGGAYSPAGSNVQGGTSSFSARFHSYDASSGDQGQYDLFANLSGSTGTPTLTFDYINTSGSDQLDILLSTDGGQTFGATPLFTQAIAGTWTRYTVPLTGATATSVIRFRATADFGFSDIGLDNVSLVYVSCAPVTALTAASITGTTASLTFTPALGGATYAVTYTPTGGATSTVTPAPTASPAPLTGLTPGTTYAVSVVTNCGGSSTSTAATTSFSTVPTNDQSAGAIAIGCNATVTGTTFGATTTGDPATACGVSASTSPGVFYSFVGTGDVVEFNTCAGTSFDTQLQVFTSSLVCVTGNDDNCGTQSRVSFTSVVGTTYYVFVNGFGANVGTFGLTSVCTPAPVTDLVVSTPQNVSGTYNNVTVQSGGVATLTGPLVVNGILTVQTGGVLAQNCQALTGTGSFVLQPGAELQICDPAGIATTGATGAIQVAGARTFDLDASYTYNGTAAQLTGAGLPGQVRNLTVNNALGLTLSQGVSIAQVARLQSGNLATGGQAFVLLSSAAGTALVDNTGGLVSGAGTMQRAVTNAITGPAYRHFSSPVASTTLADLTTTGFAPAFNTAYNSSATPSLVTPFPTVFGYDQARLATVTSTYGAFDKGWFSPTSSGDVMQPTRGYTANAPATATPIDFVGTFNNATQNSGALSRGTTADAGWQLLGNPYPSPLDWNTVAAGQRPGMDGAMYVYQSTGQYAGTYRSYDNGIGASPLIDAGSGYFARVTAPGAPGAVNLTNANRVTTFGPQPAFGRGANDARPQLQLQLTGAGLADDAFLYFEQGATAGVDAQYDATKLANPAGLDLASLSGTEPLAINGLAPLATADVVVPLTLRAPQAGSFTFEVADLANFGTATVYLRDALTGTQQQLASGTRYAFTLATATAGTGRFSVVFRPATVTATQVELTAASVSLYPNPAHGSFTVLLPPLAGGHAVRAVLVNALGQVVLTRTIGLTAAGATAEFNTKPLATGVYILRLQTENQVLTKRVVVE